MNDDETQIIAVRVPSDIVRLLDRAAKKELCSRSSYVRLVLLAALRDAGLIKDSQK